MDFKTKIVHWNCRGLKPNYNEILLLLSLLKPSVFCLQETFLKQEDNKTLKDLIYIIIFIQLAKNHRVAVLS